MFKKIKKNTAKDGECLKMKCWVFAFSPDPENCIQCPAQEHPNSERNRCLPKDLSFLGFDDPLGVSLACTALCLSAITAVVLWVFVKHWDTPIVKANNRAPSHVLLISSSCFLCSLLFIGRPSTASCILRQVTFGAVFSVAVAPVLAKTLTVILAFKARKAGRTVRQLLVTGVSNYVIPLCSLIQVTLCGVWLGTSPPFLETDTHSEPKELLSRTTRAQSLPSTPSWDTWAPWPWEHFPWLSWPGTCLTPSVKPSSWPSACCCPAASGSPSSLSATAPRARSWWPQRSAPCWPPVLGS